MKGHSGIRPNEQADRLAKLACTLPLVPPKPDQHQPSLWIHQGLPLELPISSPLLQLRDLHHTEPTAGLHIPSINLRLSSLSLFNHPSPSLVAHMHGRVNWDPNILSYWYESKVEKTCKLCHSQHATDVFTTLSQCQRLAPSTTAALCAGYKHLAPLIAQWHGSATSSERRLFSRSLVPISLQTHLTRHKQLLAFSRLRKRYPYLAIIAKIRSSIQPLLP